MDLLGGGPVLRLAGLDELDQQLGGHVAVADEQAVDVHDGVQQVLVVAGEDLQVGVLAAEHRDLGVPAAHVPHPVLGPEHALLAGDLQLGVQVVGGLGVVRVLEQDLRQPGFLPDGAVAVLRGAVLVAEPQPPVRRVGQGGLGAGGDGPLGLLDGDLGALAGDAGDDRDLVADLVDQRLDDLDLLVLGQEGALTGVPEHDQRLHPVDRGQELAQVGQCGVVHVAVDRERGDRGGVQTT